MEFTYDIDNETLASINYVHRVKRDAPGDPKYGERYVKAVCGTGVYMYAGTEWRTIRVVVENVRTSPCSKCFPEVKNGLFTYVAKD